MHFCVEIVQDIGLDKFCLMKSTNPSTIRDESSVSYAFAVFNECGKVGYQKLEPLFRTY